MSHLLELCCFVLGDAFVVEIAGTESVGTLKEFIKEKKKNALQHVDAATLNLFRVSIPFDNDLDATLKGFQPNHNPDNGVHHLSMPAEQLKEVFGDPVYKHINVIIKLPPAGERQSLWLASITQCGIVNFPSS